MSETEFIQEESVIAVKRGGISTPSFPYPLQCHVPTPLPSIHISGYDNAAQPNDAFQIAYFLTAAAALRHCKCHGGRGVDMDSQGLAKQHSERRSGSISDSVSKLFTKARSKAQSSAQSLLKDRIEEPELPLVPRGLPSLLDGKVPPKARSTLPFSKLHGGGSQKFDLPSRNSVTGRQKLKEPSGLDSISLGELSRARSLMRGKSLLETVERQNMAFKRHSLPNEPGSQTPLQPLLPLNQEYPSLSEFKALKTIGTTSLNIGLIMSSLAAHHH